MNMGILNIRIIIFDNELPDKSILSRSGLFMFDVLKDVKARSSRKNAK